MALCLGLPFTPRLFLSWLALLPAALLYAALGLALGCLMGERQVGTVCGTLMTNFSAWLSGVWFDISLLGDTFAAVCRTLPFYHAVELSCAVLVPDGTVGEHLWVCLAWMAGALVLAVVCMARRMRHP